MLNISLQLSICFLVDLFFLGFEPSPWTFVGETYFWLTTDSALPFRIEGDFRCVSLLLTAEAWDTSDFFIISLKLNWDRFIKLESLDWFYQSLAERLLFSINFALINFSFYPHCLTFIVSKEILNLITLCYN